MHLSEKNQILEYEDGCWRESCIFVFNENFCIVKKFSSQFSISKRNGFLYYPELDPEVDPGKNSNSDIGTQQKQDPKCQTSAKSDLVVPERVTEKLGI